MEKLLKMKLKSESFEAAQVLSVGSYGGYRSGVLGPTPMHGHSQAPALPPHLLQCFHSQEKPRVQPGSATQGHLSAFPLHPTTTPSSTTACVRGTMPAGCSAACTAASVSAMRLRPKNTHILLRSPPRSGPGFLTNSGEVETSQPFIPAAICWACQISALHGDGDLPRALLLGDKSRDAPGGSNHRADARKQL